MAIGQTKTVPFGTAIIIDSVMSRLMPLNVNFLSYKCLNQRSKRFLALTGVFSAVLEDNFLVLLILLHPQNLVKRQVGIRCGNIYLTKTSY